MQLVVEIMTGIIFHITVADNTTVLNLKIAIQVQENVPGDRLILLLNRDVDHLLLNDDHNLKPLSEYGVQNGSHFHTFFEPLDEAETDGDDKDAGDESENEEENDGNNNDDDSDASENEEENDGNNNDDDSDASENEEENDGNNNDDDSKNSSPKSPPSEDTSVESPEYVDVSD